MVSASADNVETTVSNNLSSGRTSPWDYQNLLQGNARLIDRSGQLLGAHIAHAGLIVFWAGAITISEVLKYDPSLPLGDQHLFLLSNLARLGWGVDEGGQIVDLYPYFVIGVLHLISSAVLGAGGLFHVFRGPAKLSDASGRAAKFHYEWTDPGKLTFILGHHLLFLGAGALGLVLKATRWGGIYDPAIGEVRLVTPNLNPIELFSYLFGLMPDGTWSAWGMANVSSLEDVIGGHVLVGVMLILGGIWHILFKVKIIVPIRLNADAILSYSLGALSFMALVSWAFVVHNETVFPPEIYGINQSSMATVQVVLAIVFLLGHLWHAFRGIDAAEGKKPRVVT